MNGISIFQVTGLFRIEAGIPMLCIAILLLPSTRALGDEITHFNIYDKDFSKLVATARSITTVSKGIRKYSIKYFDTEKLLIYEQTVSFNPETLEIVAGGFTDHRHGERASYAVLDQQTSITTRGGDDKEETRISPSASYDYSETILARVIRNLPILERGETLVLHMFVPSENRTIAFEYFLDGETRLMGRSYTRIGARASNWLYSLLLPRIQFLVAQDGSSIPVFYGPADFYSNKTRGVWIVNRGVDRVSLPTDSARRSALAKQEWFDER